MPRKRKRRRVPVEVFALAGILAVCAFGFSVAKWRGYAAQKRAAALAEAEVKKRHGWTEFTAVETAQKQWFLFSMIYVVLIPAEPPNKVALVTVVDDSVIDVEVANADGTELQEQPEG